MCQCCLQNYDALKENIIQMLPLLQYQYNRLIETHWPDQEVILSSTLRCRAKYYMFLKIAGG